MARRQEGNRVGEGKRVTAKNRGEQHTSLYPTAKRQADDEMRGCRLQLVLNGSRRETEYILLLSLESSSFFSPRSFTLLYSQHKSSCYRGSRRDSVQKNPASLFVSSVSPSCSILFDSWRGLSSSSLLS